jgi:hypothetical protein
MPAGLLPSVVGTPPPPFTSEHRQYVDQQNGGNQQASAPGVAAPVSRYVSPANPNSFGNGIADWAASLAGVDPTNPTQPRQSEPAIASNDPGQQKRIPPWVFFGPR